MYYSLGYYVIYMGVFFYLFFLMNVVHYIDLSNLN